MRFPIKNFIYSKLNEKEKYIKNTEIKYLTIIACHLNNENKIKILKSNLNFISQPNNTIIIINTQNLSEKIKNNFLDYQYFEIPNNKWADFGKWKYILETINYSEYDFITFTNDSFSIHQPISYFYNLAVENNVELYAYTSSTEVNYHYQSYLFIIRTNSIYKFLSFLNDKMKNINIKNAVQLELEFMHAFSTRKCFLDIGYFPINIKKNVFFNNNDLYYLLYNCKLLPFIKYKRIFILNKQIQNYNRYNLTWSSIT
jgi:hypothetical protein